MKLWLVCINLLVICMMLFACSPNMDGTDNEGGEPSDSDHFGDQSGENEEIADSETTEPNTPSKPETPDEPTTPGDPIEPEEPEAPTEPETPTVPETPTEPETPSDPETPTYPSGVAVFDDLTAGTPVTDTVLSSCGVKFNFKNNCIATVEIAEAKDGVGNVLRFIKNDPQNGGTVTFYGGNTPKNRIVAEFDLTIEHSTYSIPMQITLGGSYRLQLYYSVGYVKVSDARVDGSVVNYLGIQKAIGDTMKIRVEYYIGDGTAAGQYAKVYADGKLVSISQNSLYAEPKNTNANVTFYSLNSSDTQYTLDNVRAFTDDAVFVNDGDSSVRYYLVDGNTFEGDGWDSVTDILGDEAGEKLRELSEIFDERYYVWLANLYDPETAGFYFSNDGRDYIGFLPDVESTAQAFSLIQRLGLGKAQDMYTDEMRERIVAWVQSLESAEDGYFYHPQWGSYVGSGRLGRDLGWSISILERFSAEPLYPTALDRLSGSVSPVALTLPRKTSTVAAVSYVVSVGANDYLKSESNFVAYLDDLYETYTKVDENGKLDVNSYSIFGNLNSHIREIQAAGLSKVCTDYLDKKQNPDTGLWEDALSYRAASGILKISSLYESYKTEMQYGEQLTRSMIEIICSDAPVTDAVYVYNPIAGLANVLSNLNRFKNNGNNYRIYLSAIGLMRESASDIIDNTRGKLLGFKRADGSFSYLLTGSTASSSGAPVSFGGDEGDVNGAGLCQSTVSNLYKLFGVDPPVRFDEEDAATFWSIIYSKKPIEKKDVNNSVIDFEDSDGDLPSRVTATLKSDGASASIETDEDGGYLEVVSTPGAGDTVIFSAGRVGGEREAYVFVFDVDYISANNTAVNQIFLSDKSSASIFGINIVYSNGFVTFRECTSAGMGAVIISGVSASESLRVRVELTPDDGVARLTVTSNGETYAGETSALFSDKSPTMKFAYAKFYSLVNADVVARLDNVEAYEVVKTNK